MSRACLWSFGFALALTTFGAERRFDFSQVPLGQPPPGFRSSVSGKGTPGDWRIVEDEVPPPAAGAAAEASAPVRRRVLAQLAQDPTDEHFPLLIFAEESYGDFTFTTRFKTVAGDTERMAGIAFRMRDEENYYVVRASSLGNNVRFYKFVNGQRTAPIGPDVPVPSGVWHELSIECRGNQIRIRLNGREIIPMLTDNSFSRGRIGFWTKSDSVSYFADAHLEYVPHEPLAQKLVREAMERYPRLLGLRLYAPQGTDAVLRVVGASQPEERGLAATEVETEVASRGTYYFARGKTQIIVTLPLHDHNGDPVAALRVAMRPFVGQTEKNAIARALPIARLFEKQFRRARDLTE
jgi:hypothetical protein